MAVEKIPIIWVVDDKELTENERQLLRLRKATRMTEKEIQRFGKQSSQSFFNLGGAIRGLLPLLGVAGLAGALQQIVNTGKNFRAELQRLKALTGATGKEFKELETDAKRLGESTRFTATQVAQLQVEFGKLGFSTQEILKATEATLALASVAQTDLANAATVAGANVRAFGLDASETQRVVDVMAASFSSSALDIENFSEAMKFVAPIAKAANLEIEQITFLLAKLADSGLRGTIAGTGLKNVLSKLTDESSPLARSLGFTVRNAEDLQRAFTILAQQGVDLARATELADERSKAAFLTFVQGIGTTNELTTAFDKAAGSAQRMSLIIEDSLEGDIKALSSAIQGLIQDNDSALNDFLRNATVRLKLFVGFLQEGIFSTSQFGVQAFETPAEEIERIIAEMGRNFMEEEEARERRAKIIADLNRRMAQSDEETAFRQVETLTTLEAQLKKLQNQLKTTDITDQERIITINRAIQATQAEIRSIKELGVALTDMRDKNIEVVQSMQERAEVLRNILDLLFPDEDGEFGGRVETVEEMNLRMLDIIDMQIAKRIEQAQVEKEINAARIESLIEFEQANIAVFSSILGAFGQIAKEGSDAAAVFFAFQKVLAISEIIINLQRELALISATFAANPVLLGIQLGRAKVAAAQRIGVITAQTIGGLAGFAEGGIDIRGAGTSTSDSNIVRISDHESIINAQATAQYAPLLHAINSRTLDPKIADAIASGKGGFDFDYERFGEELAKHPRLSFNADARGFSFYQYKQNSKTQYLRNRHNV